MKIDNADILAFSEAYKVELLKHLENKGHIVPSSWQLIHSELCQTDEAEFDIKKFLPELSKLKFAIGIISNPELDSFLDKGQIKIRYRYVLALAHAGERKIQGNTREFCVSLIRANKIYRREDINIMSFRGTNPLAKTNYSIFRLQGHWNCRHAWQREIYFVEDAGRSVERSELIEKKIELSMKKSEKSGLELFQEWFKGVTAKFSKEEIVEVNKVLLDGEQKFLDVKDSAGKILRIDEDSIRIGASVVWVDDEGVESDVPDGELILVDDGKTVTIKDGEITEVADTEDGDTGAEDVEARLSAIEKEVAKLPETIMNAITEKFSSAEDTAKLIEKTMEAKFSEVTEELKKLPAFKGKTTKQNFSSEEDKPVKLSIGERLNSEYTIPEKKD